MTYEQIIERVKENIKKTAAKDIAGHLAVEIDVYGEGEGAFYIEVDNGKVQVEPYEYYDRDAKIYISGEEIENLLSGKKTPQECLELGIIAIEGDSARAGELVKLIKTKRQPLKKDAKTESTVKKTAAKKATAKKTESRAEKSKKK